MLGISSEKAKLFNYLSWQKQRGQNFVGPFAAQEKKEEEAKSFRVVFGASPKVLCVVDAAKSSALDGQEKNERLIEGEERKLFMQILLSLDLDARSDVMVLALKKDRALLPFDSELSAAFENLEKKKMLVFGVSASRLTSLSAAKTELALYEAHALTFQKHSFKSLFIPSLEEILSYPKLKIPVWKSLRNFFI